MYNIVNKETEANIKAGKLGAEIKAFLEQNPSGETECSTELYRCRYCPRLEVLPRIRIFGKDGFYEKVNRCACCDEPMDVVCEPGITKIPCPDCNTDLEIDTVCMWD